MIVQNPFHRVTASDVLAVEAAKPILMHVEFSVHEPFYHCHLTFHQTLSSRLFFICAIEQTTQGVIVKCETI